MGWRGKKTYVFLLLMNMANLEPNVLLREGARGRADNVLEALLRVRCDSRRDLKSGLNLPRDSVGISVAAYRLYRGESKSRWPFQSRAGSA